jgi:hypothetical protein
MFLPRGRLGRSTAHSRALAKEKQRAIIRASGLGDRHAKLSV